MTLNFSISLPGNNGSGTTTGAEQTVQVSVSLSRSPSARQLVGAATTDNILATAPVSAPAFSQILEADEAPLGPSATEEHYHVSSEGWDEEGQQAEATYAYEGDGDYDTGMSAQSTNYEYPAEAALAEEASTSVPLDPQQSEGDVDIGQSEGLEGQGGEGDYDYTREVAVSQQQQEAYTDEGGPGQDGYGEPTRYEEATGSQDVYGGGGDEYHMAEAGLQAQDGEGYGNEDGEEMVSPVYRRKSAGLSVATQQDARVYVAPPDALSPTSYDYNKDMWGDLWAYDAPNPAEVRTRGRGERAQTGWVGDGHTHACKVVRKGAIDLRHSCPWITYLFDVMTRRRVRCRMRGWGRRRATTRRGTRTWATTSRTVRGDPPHTTRPRSTGKHTHTHTRPSLDSSPRVCPLWL